MDNMKTAMQVRGFPAEPAGLATTLSFLAQLRRHLQLQPTCKAEVSATLLHVRCSPVGLQELESTTSNVFKGRYTSEAARCHDSGSLDPCLYVFITVY